MRKAIIKWLLGADWNRYFELHNKYLNELSNHINTLKQNKQLIDEACGVRKRLIQQIDEETETAKLAIEVLEINRQLKNICEEYGIDIETELNN